ncbi:MAG: peptidase domain-containing ABC transporter [Geminicoccaceae bacterium]
MSVLEGVNFGIGRRLPMVLQTEAAECGVACLAMLVGFHGQRTDLAELRRRFGVSLKGATLKDVVRVADQIELATRPLRLELGELPLVKTPCILHWDLNHFVVLKSVGRNSAVIHDPAVGVRRLSMVEVSKHFTGVALEVTPTGGFSRAEAPPRVQFRQMLGRFTGLKRSLLQLLVLALSIEVFAIASPLFMQWVVDHALISADYDLLLTLVIGFALLLLIRISVSTMRSWMLMTLGASIKVQARTNLFSHLVTLPASFFEARHLGDVMSRFSSQSTILKAITTELIEVVLDGLMVGLTLMIMFLYAPVLALLVVAGAVIYGILRCAFYSPLRQAEAETIIWGAKRDSHFLETLRGIKTIKLFNAQDSRRSHWLHLLVETVNRQLTTQKLGILFKTANSLLLGGLTLLVVWLGAREVLANVFSVGMLLAFIAYKDQFLSRVSALIDRLVELQMLKLHAERLADIALSAPEPGDLTPREPANNAPLSIEVRNLSFRYGDNDPLVLDDLSFRISAGESVAIAGPSGCGKTTLLKLMTGLLTPTAGDVLIDGLPIKRIGADAYRSMIGVVMQDDQLFAGSLADNISFFSESPDNEFIEHCARLAAVHDDIMAMPMGYHTLIGDMGTVLSGGQKQRVLIARALYRRPSILFLDEATSHLDVRRENAVSEAIRTTHITRVIVAHRPETIRSADRVVTLDKGRLANELSVLERRTEPKSITEIGTQRD